jgi:hypothetical protein
MAVVPSRTQSPSRFQRFIRARNIAKVEPELTWREDLITASLSVVLVMGLYLDGWNHINLQANELGAFLTPWHGLLYLGYTVMALWILSRCRPRLPQRLEAFSLRALWEATPNGYRPALVGIGMVSIAAPGDAIWHTVFGVETGVARVIGVFHLVLFTGMGMMAVSPLRSAWIQELAYPERTSLRRLLPAVISLAMVAASGAFLIQFSSSFVLWTPSLSLVEPLSDAVKSSPVLMETLRRAAVSQLLLTTAVLMAPVLIASRRWRLPTGSATIVFFAVGLLTAALNELALEPVLICTLIGGLVADGAIKALADLPVWLRIPLLGAIAPLALWTSFFISLAVVDNVFWPRDLWLGATEMAVLLSAMMGLLVAKTGQEAAVSLPRASRAPLTDLLSRTDRERPTEPREPAHSTRRPTVT